ncbi:MAG: hypothetical protein E2604_15305, partial [Flavobacterium sp.]|nr:hypothetical protein [Flavobacterium sp.]
MSKKPSKKYIGSNIFTIHDIDTDENFVALTVELDNDLTCKHSGILICIDEKLQYFHYTGISVELTCNIPPDKFYLKKTDVVDDDIIIAFLWHCQKLAEEVSPIYGWYFDESYYDSNGEYYLKNAKKDITTCVGFCIKVLTGFLDGRYLELNDWTIDSIKSLSDKALDWYKEHLINISKDQDIDINEILKSDKTKRIL